MDPSYVSSYHTNSLGASSKSRVSPIHAPIVHIEPQGRANGTFRRIRSTGLLRDFPSLDLSPTASSRKVLRDTRSLIVELIDNLESPLLIKD